MDEGIKYECLGCFRSGSAQATAAPNRRPLKVGSILSNPGAQYLGDEVLDNSGTNCMEVADTQTVAHVCMVFHDNTNSSTAKLSFTQRIKVNMF